MPANEPLTEMARRDADRRQLNLLPFRVEAFERPHSMVEVGLDVPVWGAENTLAVLRMVVRRSHHCPDR